jgi:bacillithiol system protein YtxJ
MRVLTSFEQFEDVWQQWWKRILFKHSTTCPISANAHRQVEKFQQESDYLIYILDVLNTGNTKFLIADKLGITHESPQVIVFNDKETIADASHLAVSARWLQQKIQ